MLRYVHILLVGACVVSTMLGCGELPAAPTTSQRAPAGCLNADDTQSSAMMRASRATAKLDEADRLIRDGEHQKAAELIQETIDDIPNEDLLQRAGVLLRRAHPSLFRSSTATLQRFWRWVFQHVVPVIVVFLLLWAISRACRLVTGWSRRKRPVWRISDISDTINLGVGDRIVAGLQQPPSSVIAGLLQLTRSPPTPHLLTRPDPALDLSPVFESLPGVGGVSFSRIWAAMVRLRSWFEPKTGSILGRVSLLDGVLTATLTRRAPDGTLTVVSASRAVSPHADAPASVADEVSFKMLYLTARECSVEETAAASELREGVRPLNDFLGGSADATTLDKVLDVIAGIRGRFPSLDELDLWKGIVVDLKGQQDDAISCFARVRTSSRNADLRRRATYNEAIANFHKYSADGYNKALLLLDSLTTGPVPDPKCLAKSPIEAMAFAARANVVAHLPMSWRWIPAKLPDPLDDAEEIQQKEQGEQQIEQWREDVSSLVSTLMSIETPGDFWDSRARLQLEWACHNALGNVLLNTALGFLRPPAPHGWGAAKRTKYYEQSLREFQACERLMPPGVETLTNLATALLGLGKAADARSYAKAATELNPSYEYAYYRLAQCHKAEGQNDAVVQTLRSFPGTPEINGFKNMFRKHKVTMQGN